MKGGGGRAPSRELERKMSLIRPNTEKYISTRTAAGTKSMSNGDPVAKALEGLNNDEVKEIAEQMGVEDVNKYDHLNPGQVRMNLGNRIRGRAKAITLDLEKLRVAAEAEDSKASDRKAYERAQKTGTFEALLEAACKGPHRERDARLKAKKDAAAAKVKEDKDAA